jgi:hypothetical protein
MSFLNKKISIQQYEDVVLTNLHFLRKPDKNSCMPEKEATRGLKQNKKSFRKKTKKNLFWVKVIHSNTGRIYCNTI